MSMADRTMRTMGTEEREQKKGLHQAPMAHVRQLKSPVDGQSAQAAPCQRGGRHACHLTPLLCLANVLGLERPSVVLAPGKRGARARPHSTGIIVPLPAL